MSDREDVLSEEEERIAVAGIYRQVANETAPENLNNAILREAAKHTRGVGSLASTWLRPAALAATLALSVGLVLQSGIMNSTTSTPPTLELPAAVGQNEDVFDAAAEAGMEQIRAAESAARANPGTSESPSAPQSRVNPASTPNTSATENRGCSEAQRSTTVSWWQCVQALEKRGMTDVARIELEALFEANPGFGVPE